MNLGIVVGVSQYSSAVGNLPACERDARAIATLLETESRFDDVLVIATSTTATVVKRQLTDFVARHKTKQIDEIVFYYTGHGDFSDGEFRYLLSDFDPKRRNQTSLENAEVDALLKSLSPRLAVKLIDACNSGMTYIKDSLAFDTYLKGTGNTFEKCYFLFSSQADQPSYQDASLSFFTRSVIKSVLSHGDSDLRYKDVMDFVSDDFSGQSLQKPFFVVQADFTETFCSVSPTLRDELQKAIDGASLAPKPTNEGARNLSLIERVKADAARFCTEQEVLGTMISLRDLLAAAFTHDDFSQIYSLSVSEGKDFTNLPDATAIGNWLNQNQTSYFAAPYYRMVTVKKKVPRKRRIAAVAMLWEEDDDVRIVEEQESRIGGFRPTVDLPFLYLHLNAIPSFPNVSANDCFVVPLVSETELRLFYTFCTYRKSGWSRLERSEGFKWVTLVSDAKDTNRLKQLVDTIITQFFETIEEQIAGSLGDSSEEDSARAESPGAGNDHEE